MTTLEDLDVLIVEDSPTQAMMLKESLEENKLHVSVARDGMEGLESIKRHRPQLIISDIEMPKMNGFDLCKQVKSTEILKDIPFILLTNLTETTDVIRGIECGADSFLTKPCPVSLLLSNISDLLENKKLRSEGKGSWTTTDFSFEGQLHQLQINHAQVTNLLLSTYANAIQKNRELEQSYRKLNLIHQELEKKNAELQRVNEEKNQFLGMAAHDLRNPLTVIQGYSTLLLEKLTPVIDQRTQSMLDRIIHSSTFMLGLINNLLNIAVIESGQITLNVHPVDFKKLVQDNVTVSQELAAKKQIKLLFKCSDPIPQVVCDSERIEEVLNNLIINAIKFSNPGTIIEVSLQPGHDDVTIVVKDQGMGIPKELKERLFQPFMKGLKGTGNEAGTGLGLAIVNKIVMKHGGKIWVESEVGKGTTFFVSLPYKPIL